MAQARPRVDPRHESGRSVRACRLPPRNLLTMRITTALRHLPSLHAAAGSQLIASPSRFPSADHRALSILSLGKRPGWSGPKESMKEKT